MAELSTKTCLFYDYGMWMPFAERLARDFGRVLYFTPWLNAYPRTVDAQPGYGVPGLERVDHFWTALEQADVVVFPDCYDADLELYLREQGVRVWGSAGAEWLELERARSRRAARASGVAVPNFKEFVGVAALRRMAARTEDKWVKRSVFRGDFETFHHQKAFVTEAWLDVIQKDYGPLSDQITFVVEDPVEGVEVGWDCHSVDGAYPELGMYGLEVKDKALIGVLKPFAGLPESVRDVYTKVAPILAEGGLRNYMTLECRVTEEGATLLDPCMRLGSPASEAWMEMVANVSEIVWEGAAGNMVQVVPAARYGVIAGIDSPWAVRNWTAVDFPKELERWVKIKNRTVIDRRTYFIPGHHEMQEIGCLVAVADSLDEAIGLCKERAKGVTGYKIGVMTDDLEDAKEVIAKGEAVGLTFD